MGDDNDPRGRNLSLELAVAASLVAPAAGCGPQPSQTDTAHPEQSTPVEGRTTADEAGDDGDDPTADSGADGADEEIPEDGQGDWSNPGSVRG